MIEVIHQPQAPVANGRSHPKAGALLRIGTFNAESYWQPPGKAAFPSIADSAALDLIATMDELLMPWRSPGGALVTMLPPQAQQIAYLHSIGLSFQTLPIFPSVREWREAGKPLCSYKAATERTKTTPSWAGNPIAPYAITENFCVFANRWGQQGSWPNAANVAKVNSKVFSTELNQRFFPRARIAVIRSIADLDKFAAEMADLPFVVKEPFGVSGKGHFLVKNQAGLERMKKLLTREREKGLDLEFIAEALLDKAADFSCFCEIDRHGKVTLRGVQSMHNRGFAYLGSAPANTALYEQLERNHYFETLMPYLQAIYAKCYWGPVCIDSMMLADGALWPVVEINARESMGIIANSICGFLASHGVSGVLTSMTISSTQVPPYGELLEALTDAGILWLPGKSKGMIPLTSTSLYVTHNDSSGNLSKSRWYAMLLGATAAEQTAIRDQWLSLCTDTLRWQILESPYTHKEGA